MEEEEWENAERCLVCSGPITRGVDRAYEFDEDSALCFECALRHGGEYDPDADRWAVPPDVSDVSIPRQVHP